MKLSLELSPEFYKHQFSFLVISFIHSPCLTEQKSDSRAEVTDMYDRSKPLRDVMKVRRGQWATAECL